MASPLFTVSVKATGVVAFNRYCQGRRTSQSYVSVKATGVVAFNLAELTGEDEDDDVSVKATGVVAFNSCKIKYFRIISN